MSAENIFSVRKLIMLLLLLSAAFSLEVSKTVTGEKIIDVNESLGVEIGISSTEPVVIEKIVDPIPAEFVAVDYPEACKQTEKDLVCSFGQVFQGEMKIEYKLRAISTGYGIIGSPQVFYEGGVATTDYFREYYVGKPKIELNVKGKTTFLRGEKIVREIELKNAGVKAIENVTLEITAGNTTKRYVVSLNPQEIKRMEVELGVAGESGALSVETCVKWNGKEERYGEVIVFVSPGIRAVRSVRVEWRLREGELVPVVVDTLLVENNGTARGNYTLSTGETFALEPGKRKKMVKEYERTAPAIKISVRDERGELYTTLSFPEQTPEIKKGFLVLLYEHVASQIPFWVLAAIALISLYLAFKFKNHLLKIALLTIFVIASLLLLSYFSVGAAVPLLSRMLSESSGLVPLLHI